MLLGQFLLLSKDEEMFQEWLKVKIVTGSSLFSKIYEIQESECPINSESKFFSFYFSGRNRYEG